MKLYQVRYCPFAHRARIVLDEKQLRYDVVYFDPSNRPAELEALSPDAKSPTLFDDDGSRIWESTVLIEYLDERYPHVALMPSAPAQRATTRLLMREVEIKLMPTLGPIVQELVFKPSTVPRDEAKVIEGTKRFREALSVWDSRLEGRDYLVGDALSLADVMLFTPLASMVRLLGTAGGIPGELEHLTAWNTRMLARPSTAA